MTLTVTIWRTNTHIHKKIIKYLNKYNRTQYLTTSYNANAVFLFKLLTHKNNKTHKTHKTHKQFIIILKIKKYNDKSTKNMA